MPEFEALPPFSLCSPSLLFSAWAGSGFAG